jgi:hypothetical protein
MAAPVTIRRSPRALLLCVLALSCGRRSVELSAPPRLETSTDPSVVGSINEQVGWLTVDDQRLYWSGRFADYNSESGGTGAALHSCEKAHCAETLVTYDPSRLDTSSGFAISNGQIYWIQLKSWENASSFQLVTCPATGCEAAPRVISVSDAGHFWSVAYGPDAMYFSGRVNVGDIFRVPFSGDAEPQRVVSSPDPDPEKLQSLTVNGDYVYELAPLNHPGVMLRRARTDGSGALETLAGPLKILWQEVDAEALSPYVNLAFDATYVYWTSNTLSGAIQRCPLSGCVGPPETLASPIRAPTALRLDGDKAYFQYFDTALGNSLASCTLPHCEPSAPITDGLDDGNVVAIDEQYVYTASSQHLPMPATSWDDPTAQIRRFPK